jgi:hypothetical protein
MPVACFPKETLLFPNWVDFHNILLQRIYSR